MSDKLFRTNVFGGYKKEDVQAYITSLETALTKLQEQVDSGNTGSVEETPKQSVSAAQPKAASPEVEKEIAIGEDVVVFGDTPEEGMEPERTQSEPDAPALDSAEETGTEDVEESAGQKELEEARRELEQVKTELQDTKAELEISGRLCEQSKRRLELALSEKELLEDEAEKLREERKNYEKDYDAVKDVLLNARLDAEIILTRARKEANQLLEETHRQIETQKKESVETLMRHLVENHTGLQASKYYLEEQVKSIERTEEQIKTLQNKMENFLVEDSEQEEELKTDH
ncbi:MAG: hypothetical protein HFH53_06560 [Hespellia sp.]|nr:hypothetical protein [Hespellia sp.]